MFPVVVNGFARVWLRHTYREHGEYDSYCAPLKIRKLTLLMYCEQSVCNIISKLNCVSDMIVRNVHVLSKCASPRDLFTMVWVCRVYSFQFDSNTREGQHRRVRFPVGPMWSQTRMSLV